MPRSLPCMLLLAVAGHASARPWACVSLHPAGYYSSAIYAVGPDIQAGFLKDISTHYENPALWHGSAVTATFLANGTTDYGHVLALWGDNLAGDLNTHATLWTGPLHSPADLNPAGSTDSGVLAMRGSMQAGWIRSSSGNIHAACWLGSAASVVDLHPPSNHQPPPPPATGGPLTRGGPPAHP